MRFTLTSTPEFIDLHIGSKSQHTIRLAPGTTRKQAAAALRDIPGVKATRPASVVTAEARAALVASGLAR